MTKSCEYKPGICLEFDEIQIRDDGDPKGLIAKLSVRRSLSQCREAQIEKWGGFERSLETVGI